MLQQSNVALLAANRFHKSLASKIPSYWQAYEWGPILSQHDRSAHRTSSLCVAFAPWSFFRSSSARTRLSSQPQRQTAWHFVFAVAGCSAEEQGRWKTVLLVDRAETTGSTDIMPVGQ